MVLQGTTAKLELFDDKIVLTSTGALGKMSQKGSKTIFINQITGIQYKPATALTGGYLHFTLPGGLEKTGGVLGASASENAIVFSKKENSTAEDIKSRIERLIASSAEPVSADDTADKIIKYKSLLDQGILTQEEFDTMKKQLLGL